MLKKIALSAFIFSLIFISSAVFGQIKLPPISNFNAKDYGGGNQNWSIDTDGLHVYIANNEGLLEFDGINWYLNKLPNKTIIRSVKVVNDKIYTGSYEEFGFWQRLNNGKLEYTSLSKTLSASQIESQSIWGIYKLNDQILFKSFGTLFIYEKGKIEILKADCTIMAGFVINNQFIVQGVDKGLLKLVGNKLEVIKNTEQIANDKVQSICLYKNNELLIGTSLHGLFTYSNNKLTQWESPFNNLLKEHQLNSLIYFEGKIYAGTIKKGIFEYDINSNTFINLTVKNGLQNNTVLASTIDSSKILWLALDNGISAIPTDFYAYYLNPFKEDIGAVYDIVQLNDEVFLATNTGIYKATTKGVNFIEGSQGHIWSLSLVGNEIICGHNSGTYKILNDQLSLVSPKNGGYVFKAIPEYQNKYIQGNYSGLTIYDKNGEDWTTKDVENINIPIKNIAFEKSHVAWVSHAFKGVYRVEFSENYDEIIKIEEQYNSFFKNAYDLKLFNIERNIAFYSDDKWYVYNSLEDKIEEFKSLNKVLGKDKNSIILNKDTGSSKVFKRRDNKIFFRKNIQDSLSQIYLPIKYYVNRLVRGEGDQRAVVINDSLIYISLYNDILVVNPKKLNKNINMIAPSVSRLYVNGKAQDLLSDLTLEKKDTVLVELSSPLLSNNSIEYSIGNNYWISTNGKIELTGLPNGSVNLSIRSFSNFKVHSDIKTIKLYVNPPWYLGFWGVVILLAFISLVFYLITTINKYVLIKHKNYLDEQFEHAQEIHRKEEALKNEIKLNELQKKQHEIQLDAKTKELANTAMEMTKKDELLENIKGDLHFFKKEIISKPKFDKLLSTINKNITTSKDWEVFESNFNEIHDSFFKSLIKNHSQLTAKDLKLCAYLKMNLATKEIAPLMGISARGVEIHRYRLRKKLNIDNNQNLNEYFIKI